MIAENRDALRAITGSLTHITAALEQAVGEGQLDTTLAVVHGAAENASLTMTELRATNESLGRILARLEAGEGTAGRLLTEDSLYVRADSTLMSMQRLIDQMRRNPKAMLNMSLF